MCGVVQNERKKRKNQASAFCRCLISQFVLRCFFIDKIRYLSLTRYVHFWMTFLGSGDSCFKIRWMPYIFIIVDFFKNLKFYILKSFAVIVSRVTQSKFNYFFRSKKQKDSWSYSLSCISLKNYSIWHS